MPFVEVILSMVKMNSRKTLAVTDFEVTYLARESLSFFSCSCSAGIISSRSSAIASSDVSSPCWAFSVFIVASTLSFFSIKRLRKNWVRSMQDLVGKKTRVLYYQWTENSISMFNSLTPMSDQDRIPPCNLNTISTR